MVLSLCLYGSTEAFTGDRSLKDRPRIYFPRVFTHTIIPPLRLSSILPLTQVRDPRRFGVIGFRAFSPLIRGRDARRFGVDPSINWGDIYLYIFAPRRDRRSPRRVPPKHVLLWLGVSQSVHRDVKHPVGPWGSNWALADLESYGLTGICFRIGAIPPV